MLEPDHILLRPLPNFMRGERPAAYSFAYMDPYDNSNRGLIKRYMMGRWGAEVHDGQMGRALG